jgi:His Kinase A (phospho-acceptor) domain
MAHGPWMKAAVASAALALMAAVHLWTIDRLDALHRASQQTSAASLARSFSTDEPPTRSPSRSGAAETATAIGAGKAPLPRETLAPMPAAPAGRDMASTMASTKHLTAPLSYWHSQEMMLSFGGSVLLFGLALAMIVSIARGAARQPGLLSPAAAITSTQPLSELARLAEQARSDADEAVHEMRTPIATIMGNADALKRAIPPENVKAWRAVKAMDASTARLNRALDQAWARAESLASLVQAKCEAVDLCALARTITAEAPDRHIVGPAPVARYVFAPRASLEEAVRTIFEAFATEADQGSVLAACSEAAGSLVRLTLSRDGPVLGEPVDDVTMKRWPDLREAARLVGLLGGQVRARATTTLLQEVVVEFPSRASA